MWAEVINIIDKSRLAWYVSTLFGVIILFVAHLSGVCSRRSATSGLTLRFERKVIEEPNAGS